MRTFNEKLLGLIISHNNNSSVHYDILKDTLPHNYDKVFNKCQKEANTALAQAIIDLICETVGEEPTIEIESNWVDGGAVRIDAYISKRNLINTVRGK